MDDEGKFDPRDHAEIDRYGESLLYDFAKFLTTLSILAIGGVLTITETADRADNKTANIAIVTIALSLAALSAVSTANAIAQARYTGKDVPNNLHYFLGATTALLGMGLGMFLFMWIDKLN